MNSEQEAGPQELRSAIDTVRQNHVPAVFCESTVSDRQMQQVVEATAEVVTGSSDHSPRF